ncbi:MAG: polynucleotide adenylyltransferase [Gammaproteobacteria bacterium]|nr:polynucleotide adenylyltransferase [Gammaproteobacteria bacterium]
MEIYLVGGAVRDDLLGVANNQTENDYVVVGGSAEEMLSLGYRQVGKEFPVFLHPKTHDEYALARTERKVSAGYTGFEFNTATTVSLEEDLSRRDLTVNAIAKSADGELIDPFGGADDIDSRTLRHVSDAFKEDPVRVLRVARFTSRFYLLGFSIAEETKQLMNDMVASGEVDALVSERVFKELSLSLSYDKPAIFFDVLLECGAFQRLFPMLDTTKGSILHIVDIQDTSEVVRFALWLYQQEVGSIQSLCSQLKCPKEYQQLAELSASWYLSAKNLLSQSADSVLGFIIATDALRRQRRFGQLLEVFDCLGINTYPIEKLVDALKQIDVSKLNKAQIVSELASERLTVTQRFLDSTK